jgi:hypothetical protein
MVDFNYFNAKGSVPINTKPMQEAAESESAAYQGAARAFNESLAQGRQIAARKAEQESSQNFSADQQARLFSHSDVAQERQQSYQRRENELNRGTKLDVAAMREAAAQNSSNQIELRRIAQEERAAQQKVEYSDAFSKAQGFIQQHNAASDSPFFKETKITPLHAFYGKEAVPEEVAGQVRAQIQRDSPGLMPDQLEQAVQDHMKALSKPRTGYILPPEAHEPLFQSALKAVAGDTPTIPQREAVRRALDQSWGNVPHDETSLAQSFEKPMYDEMQRGLALTKQAAGPAISKATSDREARQNAIEQGRQSTVEMWNKDLATLPPDDPRREHLQSIIGMVSSFEKPSMSFMLKTRQEYTKARFPLTGQNAVKSIPAALTAKIVGGSDDEARAAAAAYVAPHLQARHADIMVNEDGKIRPPDEQQRLSAEHLKTDVQTLLDGLRPKGGAAPAQNQTFEQWKAKYAPRDSGEDYDLKGAYRAGVAPDAQGHMPDTFKKPNHPTFSVESQYVMDAPTKAGFWRGDTFVKPAPDNLRERAISLRDSMRSRNVPDADVAKAVDAFLKAN